MQNRKRIAIIIFVASTALLIAKLYLGFAQNHFNYWSIAANVLLALAMVLNYRIMAKAGKESR